jgi:hypothetical protein
LDTATGPVVGEPQVQLAGPGIGVDVAGRVDPELLAGEGLATVHVGADHQVLVIELLVS